MNKIKREKLILNDTTVVFLKAVKKCFNQLDNMQGRHGEFEPGKLQYSTPK